MFQVVQLHAKLHALEKKKKMHGSLKIKQNMKF